MRAPDSTLPMPETAVRVSGRRWYVLGVLTLVYISNIADRFVISTLIEPIKADLQLSDTAIGFLTGTALALFYTGMGIPLGLIADRVNRRNLIAISIAVWSVMTAACGAARTFSQLLLARIGVGIGEAGGTPASQSMIADLFPLQQRALAMSIFALGAAAGSMLGSTAGGAISDAFGWRWAFIALGIPGILVALLVRLTVSEPPRGAFDTADNAVDKPSLAQTLEFIRHQPSLLHVLAGGTVVTFWGWGLLWWTPAFLSRSYGMTTGEAGALMGTINGVAGAAGILLGAILIHKLGRRDPRWQAWIVGIATVIGTVVSIVAYASRSQTTTAWMLWAFVPVAYLNIGPLLALTQSLSRPRMRGVVCALLLFGANIANLAIAPQLIGIVSDLANHHFAAGRESLRYALIGTAFCGFWAAWHFWRAGRTLPEGLRRAGA